MFIQTTFLSVETIDFQQTLRFTNAGKCGMVTKSLALCDTEC